VLSSLRSPSKYAAVRTAVDGITFASRREAKRYAELRLLEKAGEISRLVTQPHFPLEVQGVLVCTYIADFSYSKRDDAWIVEDCKGVRTAVYRIKRKLMKAVYGIEILET
jgi:hypothetical protein